MGLLNIGCKASLARRRKGLQARNVSLPDNQFNAKHVSFASQNRV
jgi:hypothetical protein